MKYRSIANGNVVDSVPASLVGVLYEEIPEQAASTAPAPDLFQQPKPRTTRKPRAPKVTEE